MAGNDTNNAQEDRSPQPNPALKSLDVMVGTWELKGRESGPDGEIQGRPTFEWMEGGFYLVQRVDLDYIGHRVVGVEYIGYDEDNKVLRSYFFSNDGPFGPSGELPRSTPGRWATTPSRSGSGMSARRRASRASSATSVTPLPVVGNGLEEATRQP